VTLYSPTALRTQSRARSLVYSFSLIICVVYADGNDISGLVQVAPFSVT